MVSASRAPLRRRLLGAFISVVVAWLFLQIVMEIFTHTRGLYRVWWVDPLFFAYGSLPFVFVPWLLVFLPLYLFVPPRSVLWRWAGVLCLRDDIRRSAHVLAQPAESA